MNLIRIRRLGAIAFLGIGANGCRISTCQYVQEHCVIEREQRTEVYLPTRMMVRVFRLVDEGKDGNIDYKETEFTAGRPGGRVVHRTEPSSKEMSLGNQVLQEYYNR